MPEQKPNLHHLVILHHKNDQETHEDENNGEFESLHKDF